MLKTDLYTVIHKAQRAHLFTLSARIGRTDFSNPEESALIKQKLSEMISHLRKHSIVEATFIHPLFAELGNSEFDEEHEELEGHLLQLEQIVEEKRWQELYSAFNRFLALYLIHQDEEERAQVDILWKHFDDTRLSGVLNAFMASRSPAMALEDLKFLLPALSLSELTHMFQGMKMSAPPQAFQAASEIAKTELEPNRWTQLDELLRR